MFVNQILALDDKLVRNITWEDTSDVNIYCNKIILICGKIKVRCNTILLKSKKCLFGEKISSWFSR